VPPSISNSARPGVTFVFASARTTVAAGVFVESKSDSPADCSQLAP
jgi:hypothetical protein